MQRADASYLPQYFGVDSKLFKDDESETEAKTNSGHRAYPLLACTEHAQCPLALRTICKHTHRARAVRESCGDASVYRHFKVMMVTFSSI